MEERAAARRWGIAVVSFVSVLAVAGAVWGGFALFSGTSAREPHSSASPATSMNDEAYVQNARDQIYCLHSYEADHLITDLTANKVTTTDAVDKASFLKSSMTTDGDLALAEGHGVAAAKIHAHARAMDLLRQSIETASTDEGGKLLSEYFTQAAPAMHLCPPEKH